MKKKQINTGVADMLLVELLDGAYMVNINTHSFVGLHYMLYEDGVNTPYKERLPDGNWSILCRADEVTEEQANELCHVYETILIGDVYYDYLDNRWTSFDSLESLDSLYEANEVYFKNKYGNEPVCKCNCSMCIDEWHRYHDKWKKEQYNVWDKSRTYILIKRK